MSADPRQIEAARQKVEAGEPLNRDELDLLERVAREEGSPQLRLAVAQALINAGEDRQALTRLETLKRDFPNDVQVHLGRARAFVSLERYRESELSLKDALAVNPGDPEAMKALAVFCLRRGELERARHLVGEVLKRDPFDSEAQILSGELSAADLSEVARGPVVSLADFGRDLSRRLDERSISHKVDGEQLLVQLGRSEVARLDLSQLHLSFLHEGGDLGHALDVIARELVEGAVGMPKQRAQLLASVLPVIRDEHFLDRGIGTAHREGPAGTWVFYVIENPSLVQYVPQSALDGFHLSLADVDAAAWQNLARQPIALKPLQVLDGAPRIARADSQLWGVVAEDGHDAARLISKELQPHWMQTVGPGPHRVFLGLRELAVVCQERNAPAVLALESITSPINGVAGRYRLDAAGNLVALPASQR